MGSSGQEEAPGIFWAWVEAASGNMALALTTLVEQVQSWAKGVGVGGLLTLQPVMDTLGTLLVGWMIFVTLILILGTFFYFKFIHHLENEGTDTTTSQGRGEDKGGATTSGAATQGKAKAIRKEEQARKPTIVPDDKPEPVSVPLATGADPDAVKWACNVFTWLYNSAEGGKVVSKIWLDTLNENTVKTAIETGILIEVVELMKQTPGPVLSNMVVDCSPTDNVTITCDCDATLYLRIITTRTQGDKTTESEYACAVTPLRGRLNIASVTAELLAVAKFDGWPEVSLTLEGIRNNSTGRNEQQMLDVINEVVSSALRNSVLEFNFQPNQTFPRFRRARQVPDPIIPVGYDSMVREKQTHPPSVPRKTPKADFVPLHNEKIEPAGESFTALTFSNLTSSEEQLIARNLNKYPSLENADMAPEEIEEFCKTWQENYVPAKDVPPPVDNTVEEEPPPSPTAGINADHQQESEAKTQNFVLMVSSRSKLIDEPRNILPLHNDIPNDEMNGEEEEEELADMIPQRPRDEPCLRKETGSPLLLGTPRQDSLGDVEDDDFEDAKLQFDRLEILDKPQISGALGLGPLQKGPFVSEACCVGVQVGVAAQLPQLDLRIETAAVGGSVACDLPEYDQEASARSPLPPSLHNQPSTATTHESCVDDVSRGPEEPPSPSPIHSLSPELFIPAASGVFHLVDDSNNERGVAEWEQQVVSAGERDSTHSSEPSGVVACIELGKGSVLDRKDLGQAVSEGEDQSFSKSTTQDQDVDSALVDEGKICSLDAIPSPDNSDGESLEGNSLLDSHTDSANVLENSEGSVSEEREVGPVAGEEEESKLKICLNEFTENLFRHIEVEDSELSIPEERVEDLPWEVVDVYEPDSPPMSLPSPGREASSDGSEELEGPDLPPAIDAEEPKHCSDPKTESEDNTISSAIDKLTDEDQESEEHCDEPERETEENVISSDPESEKHCDEPEIETEENVVSSDLESKKHCDEPEIETEENGDENYVISSDPKSEEHCDELERETEENGNENYVISSVPESEEYYNDPEIENEENGDVNYTISSDPESEKHCDKPEIETEENGNESCVIFSDSKSEEHCDDPEIENEENGDENYVISSDPEVETEENVVSSDPESEEHCNDPEIETEEKESYSPPPTDRETVAEEPESNEHCSDPETEIEVHADKSYMICSEENKNFNENYFHEEATNFKQTSENLEKALGDSEYKEKEDKIEEEQGELEEDSGYICIEEKKEETQTETKDPEEDREDSGFMCTEESHAYKEEEDSHTEEEDAQYREDSGYVCTEEIDTHRDEEDSLTEESQEYKVDSGYLCSEDMHRDHQTEEEQLKELEEDFDKKCTEHTNTHQDILTEEEELDKLNKYSSESCIEETHFCKDEEDIQTEEERELDEEDSSEEYTGTTVNSLSSMPHAADSSPVFLDENGNGVETDTDIDEDIVVSSEKDADEDDETESTEMEVNDRVVTAEVETCDNDVDSNEMEVSSQNEVDEDDTMKSTEIKCEEKFVSIEKEVSESDAMNNFEKEIEERFIIAEKEAEDDTMNSTEKELEERLGSAEKEADDETEIKLDYSFISTARDTDEDDSEPELEDKLVDDKKTDKEETDMRSTEAKYGNKDVDAKLVDNVVNNAAEVDFFDSGIGHEIDDEDNLVSIGHDEGIKLACAMIECKDNETISEIDKEIDVAIARIKPEGNLVSSEKDDYINVDSAKKEHEDNDTNTGKDIHLPSTKIEPEESTVSSENKDTEIEKTYKDIDTTKIEPLNIEINTVTYGNMNLASAKTQPGDNITSTETHKAVNIPSINSELDSSTNTEKNINTASTEITCDDILNAETNKTANIPCIKIEPDNMTNIEEDINTASTEITCEDDILNTETNKAANIPCMKIDADHSTSTGEEDVNTASTEIKPEDIIILETHKAVNIPSTNSEPDNLTSTEEEDVNIGGTEITPENDLVNTETHKAVNIPSIKTDSDHITSIEENINTASTEITPEDDIINTETHNLPSIKTEPDLVTSTEENINIEITPKDYIVSAETQAINVPTIKIEAEDNLTSTEEDDTSTTSTEITLEDYLNGAEVELDEGSNFGNGETEAESKDVVDAEMKFKDDNVPCTITEMKSGKDNNKGFTETELSEEILSSIKAEDNEDKDANTEIVVNKFCTEVETDKKTELSEEIPSSIKAEDNEDKDIVDSEVIFNKFYTEIETDENTELGEEILCSIKVEDNEDKDIVDSEVIFNKFCIEMETDENTNEGTEIQLTKSDRILIETDIDGDLSVGYTGTINEDTSGVSSETESDRDSHNISTEIEVDNDELSTEEANKDSSYVEIPNEKTNLLTTEFDKDTDMTNTEFNKDSKGVDAETEFEETSAMNREVETNDRGRKGNSQVTELVEEADGNEDNRDIVNRNGDSQETEQVDRGAENREIKVDKNNHSQDTEVKDINMEKQITEIGDKNVDNQGIKGVEAIIERNVNNQEKEAPTNGFNQEVKLRERNRDGNKIQRRVSSATDLDKMAQLLIQTGDLKTTPMMKTTQKTTNGIHPETEVNRNSIQVNTEARFDGETNKNGHAVEILRRNSNGINSKTELSRSVDSNNTSLSKATKTQHGEDEDDDTETEIDEEMEVMKNTTTKTVPSQASRKPLTRHHYRTRHPIDTYSASELEEEHDHFDATLRRIRRHKLQVTFLVSDSGEDTAVSISSLESLNTQLQEAEKNTGYISLRSPSFWDDSTTDANTDDEYTDPRLLPKDPFSPEEEDFGYSGYASQHSAYDSMTDSEVEGITGRYIKGPPGRLQIKREWRKSDIDLIADAEMDKDDGQVTPTPTVFQDEGAQSSQDNVEGAAEPSEAGCVVADTSQKGGDQTSHHDTHQPPSQEKEDISPKDTEDSSHKDVVEDRATIQEAGEETKTEQQKQEHVDTSMGGDDSAGLKKSMELTGKEQGGGGETTLTTGPENVAPLTHTDSTGALTQPQVKPHTGQWVDGGGDGPDHHPPVPGSTLWTRHLPSYPVFGPYSVTTTSHSTTSQPMGIPGLNGKRLLVKIVKAMGVGCEKPVLEAYSVVEMDEPPQKFTTSVVKDTNSPFWDEQFLFDLSGGTLELLFELYDKSNGTFLGLGIVGIEELVATPSQRQIIPLQSRPYENDEVSGSLTVEFLFLDRADLPEHTLRASTTSKSVTPRGDLITTTTTTYIKAPEAQDPPIADVVVNGGDGVAAAAIRDIEEKAVVANNASKSTMIIHASKKPDQDGQGYMDDLYNLAMTATTTGTPTITTTGASTAASSTTTTTAATSSVPPSTAASTTETAEDEERGRSRGVRRKRDSFFGTLKKRFSRSKVRSKSMDPGARDSSLERDPSVGRSISMERSSNLNRASGLLSVPSGTGGDAGSTRSSLSDASAISGSSTRTYVNEASTLIIETSENGVFKHYLIPLSLQQKSKWRKKGLKLHVFGEHTFIAKHMSSSTQCEVCQKTLGRRFGKQGYICRDCGYKCHKPCHVKTETTCPNSTVNNMDLEYVRDPKEERRAWLKKNKTA